MFKTSRLSRRNRIIRFLVLAILVVGVVLVALLVNNGAGEGSRYSGTFVSLLPAVIAIILALVTQEAYASLFVGIVCGALFAANFSPAGTLAAVTTTGFISVLADSWNVGILVFLVLLGFLVALMNAAGGARAFGRWARAHVKTRKGAQAMTLFLGLLIFVDDYFNCLTVGSVMRPLTDAKGVSREKLAYFIDSTAAPVCMIAPISSWAAAVSAIAASLGMNGIALFCEAIPFNFYSLLTIAMMIFLIILDFDFGPMASAEARTKENAVEEKDEETDTSTGDAGRVSDLVVPVVVLIACCVLGMLASGGFFTQGETFLNLVNAFAASDASIGLAQGALVAVILDVIWFLARKTMSFKTVMASLATGFKAMVPAILILTLAWTLNAKTSALGAAEYVASLMTSAAPAVASLLPALVFLVAIGLSFSTGTSWGTFGILLPIVVNVFRTSPLLVVGISACLAGAVCGDHCSPISDTTIMASAGAECPHLSHVRTQLPYALVVAGVSLVLFIIAGFLPIWWLLLLVGLGLLFGILVLMRRHALRKAPAVPTNQ